VFEPFNWIVVMCALAGLIMVTGSIALLYSRAIQLSEKHLGQALEAQFQNQLRINIRNPAIALFAIGVAFFWLALHFAQPESAKLESELVIMGHVEGIASLDGAAGRLTTVDVPITVNPDGSIFTTTTPVERIKVVIEPPPGYGLLPWYHQFNLSEIKHGRVEIYPKFISAGTKPKPDIQPPQPIYKSRTPDR
jgi:hypothetical protein